MKRKGAPGAGADACRATGFLGSFPALYGVRTGRDSTDGYGLGLRRWGDEYE